MADDMRKLLDYIVANYVVRDELKAIDLDASPREPGEVIEADKEQVVRRETDQARDLGQAFARGLALAYHRRNIGGAELPLDDRKPDENRIADALIRFLVSHDFASSRTQETVPLHYTYHVAVDWDRLNQVADDAGIDLDRALQHYSV